MKNLLLIVLLFLTIGVGWYFYGATIERYVDVGQVVGMPVLFGKDAVLVHDQPADGTVELTHVLLSRKGFIVIQDDDDGPGDVIGVSDLLEPGRYKDFAIPMTSDGEPGYVFASLYQDDGDGVFVLDNDIPVRGPALAPVQYRFSLIDPNAPPSADATETIQE